MADFSNAAFVLVFGGLLVLGALGALGGGASGAGGTVAVGATIRVGPARWVFRAGFVGYFAALQFRMCRGVHIGVVGRAVVHANV